MNILDLKRKLLPMSGYQSGGGGSGGGSTTSTSYQTNIPEYAREYVENMLMATQKQIYKPGTGTPQYEDVPIYEERLSPRGMGAPVKERVQTGTERRLISGSETPTGDPESFQGYKAYGGTYAKPGQVMKDPNGLTIIDSATGKPRTYEGGEQISYDPGKGIAGFQPMQTAAQQGIAAMKLPDEFADASTGITSAMGATNAYTAPKNLGYTSSDATTRDATSSGYTSSDALASTASAAKLGLAPTAAEKTSTYAPTLQEYQMGGADKVATKSFTDKGTAASYMSPYMANVLDIQNKELERQAGIAGTQRGAQAARAGAFGGSRQGIENAEANRNLAMMKNANAAQGMQQAYGQAMQQFNAEQGYGLQGQIANQQAGLTVGQQNLGANLGVQQLKTQTGTQIDLANLANKQQTELANQALKGQYGLTQGQFDQGANMQTSAQAQQAALANAAAKSAASQFGAAAGNQASLANSAASNQASLANAAAKNAAAQFGAGQNLASAQTAAQYGLAADQLKLQASGQLGALGSQELQAQQGIYGLQNQVGAQQQGLEQQKLNQAQLDYANEQQYPLMQLGTMSNMLRGLPMQASTTNQYQAQPNLLTQAVGAAGTGAALYNAFNPSKTGASGGLPSEFKYSKGGGIMSYDVGGEVESDLENMDEEGLQKQLKESSSPSVKRIAQRILRERQMSRQAQGTGPMGVQYQAAQAPMPSLAGGGIIAFAKPTEDNNQSLVTEKKPPIFSRDIYETFDPTLEGRVDSNKSRLRPIGRSPLFDALRDSQFYESNKAKFTPKPEQAAQGIVQPAPTFNQTVQGDVDLTPAMKAAQSEAAATAAVPVEDIIARNQAARKAAGIEAPGIEQRARLMAERANAEDEAERTRNLRLAEFFASWGSTPGDTLTAGMLAFKNKVPDMISDEKEARRVRMEIDKALAALDEATRLEKVGNFDAATAEKQKAAEIAKAVNFEVIKIGQTEAAAVREATRKEAEGVRTGQREEAKDTRYATLQREITQMKIDSDERLKKIDAKFRAEDKVEGNTNRLITLYTSAQSDRASVESRISNIMKSDEYQRALADAGEKINADSSDSVKKMQANAAVALKGFNDSFKTQRETVDNTIKFMEERLSAKGVPLPEKKPKGSDTPPDPPPGSKVD